jgi:uncharacterized protein
LAAKFQTKNEISRPCLQYSKASDAYNVIMASQIPLPIQAQKYISLTTFRKTGAGVPTPVWFGEEDGKLYVMTRSDMGKTKRIRNNPQVKVAPSTIRGKVTGPEFSATARILPREDHQKARASINRKYWMARIPLIWSRTDTYFEITFA